MDKNKAQAGTAPSRAAVIESSIARAIAEHKARMAAIRAGSFEDRVIALLTEIRDAVRPHAQATTALIERLTKGELEELVCQLRENGLAYAEIATVLGCSVVALEFALGIRAATSRKDGAE